MRRTLTPSIWVWLALGLVCLVLTMYLPARTTSPSMAPDQHATGVQSTSPVISKQRGSRDSAVAVDQRLDQSVRATLGEDVGHYGVIVKELDRGTGVAINPDRVFYAASLFKIAVMYEAFHQHENGQLRFDTMLTVTQEAAEEDLGTLDLFEMEVGGRLSVGELVERMVTASDNTASVMLRDALGRKNVDRSMRGAGLRSTSVASPNLPTTAADMALLLEVIATGRAVSPAASEEMVRLLQQQRVRDRIPAGLPPAVSVGNKTGSWDSAAHDVAIVYAPAGTYLLAVLSDLPGNDDTIAALSRQVYAYYNGGSGE